MRIQKRNYFVLLLLALLFMMPGLMAYLYYLHPQWLGTATTNKGALVSPPVLFSPMKGTKKWALVLWYSRDCDDVCLQQLDKLARIRLALGRQLYKVDQWLVTSNATQLPKSLVNTLREQDIHIMYLAEKERDDLALLAKNSQVFIANPDNYLILTYPVMAKSDDIFHDVKHLLGTAEK